VKLAKLNRDSICLPDYATYMKKRWNSLVSFKPVKVVILMLILLFIFATVAFAYYRAKYTESAHENTSYGVNRPSIAFFEYARGNCAHCHEQHAMIGGEEPTPPAEAGPEEFMLFYSNNPSSQDDNFCFQCHKSGSTIQSVTNYTYSKNFGGGPSTFTNIYDAFNPPSGGTPSSHNLSDVLNHTVSRGGGFTSDTNACVVCHDPHIAQRQIPVASSGMKGGVYTSIRRPVDYQSYPSNLWGDEDAATSGLNERMRDYTANYQAPYFLGGINYEPANNTTYDGSNLPNYVNFCTNNCHSRSDVYSTERSRNLISIDWSTHQHGGAHNGGSNGASIAPYTNAATNYRLSCTDCHEPHGSQNEWLLRTTVNGTNVSVTASNQWWYFCSACHTFNQHTAPWGPTTDCNNSGICHRHGAGSYMF